MPPEQWSGIDSPGARQRTTPYEVTQLFKKADQESPSDESRH